MKLGWLIRLVRPGDAQRHTDEVLAQVRFALEKLDRTLAAIEARRIRGSDGRE